jgi:ribonucleotide monophosphatase NagD (HAD superfamily)
MDTALVLTGSTRRADLDRWTGPAPTHVLESVGELPDLCRG